MRKLIKLTAVAALTACVACFSSAATIMDTGFRASDTPAYSDADLAGQNGWTAVANTGANAFQVKDTAGNGYADTAGTSLNITNGNYVYYGSTVSGAASNELSGSLDFTLSSTVGSLSGGDIFRFGISSTVNTNLSALDTNQVYLGVNISAAGAIKIRAVDEAGTATNLCSMLQTEAGWSATETPLPVTDTLRVTWKIRKTAVDGTYTLSATLTNLVNASTNSTGNASIVKAGAYGFATPYFMMGLSGSAFSTTSLGVVDIAIDNLSLTNNTDVAPTLFPTAVSANPGDTRADLLWTRVYEAETLDVQRSSTTATGTYTTVASLPGTTINYTDLTVTNGEAYYYKVTWHATGAADASSQPVVAEPNAAKTGLIFDTSFRNTDTPAYASGDLAGQNKWKSIAASGAPAFYVDSTGNGFADTAPYSNSFNNVTGNQVYYNEIMSNGVGAAWSGTSVFTLKATPEVQETKIKTNTVDEVVTVTTNTQQVAFMPGGRVFEFGLSSDTTSILDSKAQLDDVLITVRSTTSAGALVLLNGYGATVNLMLDIPKENLGWDPEWSGTNAAPDFETDPITLNWQIRKTASNLVYSGSVSLNVGTNSYTGMIHFTDEKTTQPVSLYAAPVARFAMSHSFNSQTNSTNTMVNVSIDSLSLIHTNDSPIMNAAPFGLSGVVGNTNITLSWLGAIEASSFDIYRSVGYSNTTYTLRGSVTNLLSFLDTGLTDLQLYNYKVVAKYDTTGASNTSVSVSCRARARVTMLEWNSVGKVTGNVPFPTAGAVTNSGVINYYGTFDGANQAFAYPGAGPGTYTNAAAVYGVVQLTGSTALRLWQMNTLYYDCRVRDVTAAYSNNVSSQLLYIKAASPMDMTTSENTYELTAAASANYRAAFRDSGNGKWYVSDNTVSNPTTASLIIPSLANPTNKWRELTVTTSSLMDGTNGLAADGVSAPVPSFTAVDAVGLLADRATVNIRPTLLKVTAVAPLPTYTISNITTDVRGSIENNTATPTNNRLVVSYGDSPVFTITGTNGFRIATLKTNGADVANMTFGNTSTKTNFTWYNVTANGTLAATFTERFYTLAVTNGTGSGVDMYTNGQHVAIVASNVVNGQIFTYWTGNTNYLIVTNVFEATNTVVMGPRNLQLTANYRLLDLTVIGGSGSGSYYIGTELTIAATNPSPGYVFDKWTGDTAILANSNVASTTATITNRDSTVTSTYKPSAVTLTATVSGGNGTITPASASVSPGNSTNFVITANNYYRIATLTTNGASAGVAFNNLSTNYTYTWPNVQAAGTVTVSFVAQVTTNAPATVPYSWLAQYFVTNNYDNCANADQDGDGAKTWQEYIALSVPTNKASVFAATLTNRNTIIWSPVATGRYYTVYWTTNLATKVFSNKQDNIVYPQGSYTNASPDARVNQYQVKVRFQ